MNELTKYALKCSIIVFSFALFVLLFTQCFAICISTGESMYPTMSNKNLVFVRKVFLPSNLTGYIVLFKWNSTLYIIHRCIADNGTHILTKGDNNVVDDGWRPKTDVIGIVKFYVNLP
jgi:signal peptidase I